MAADRDHLAGAGDDRRRHPAFFDQPVGPDGAGRGAFDEVEQGGKWDWNIGGDLALARTRLGLAYVGSDADGSHRKALVATLFGGW